MKNQKNNMLKREKISLHNCYFCKGNNIKEKKEFIISKKGINTEINAFECQTCGQTFYSMEETERVRKILHPSFIQKIKNNLNKPAPQISIFKGKVI